MCNLYLANNFLTASIIDVRRGAWLPSLPPSLDHTPLKQASGFSSCCSPSVGCLCVEDAEGGRKSSLLIVHSLLVGRQKKKRKMLRNLRYAGRVHHAASYFRSAIYLSDMNTTFSTHSGKCRCVGTASVRGLVVVYVSVAGQV